MGESRIVFLRGSLKTVHVQTSERCQVSTSVGHRVACPRSRFQSAGPSSREFTTLHHFQRGQAEKHFF